MKKKGKAFVLTLCALLLVSVTVWGTVSYLTSKTEEVVNTFTVGSVKLELDETDVDLNGDPVSGAPRVTENEYKLMPGHTYTKDPTVRVVKGSEDCYIRMIVRIKNYSILTKRLGADTLPQNFASWDSDYWECESYDMNGNDALLEFRHNAVVTDKEKIPALFKSITLPAEIENMNGLDKVKIFVVAEAIQADGFDKPEDAFKALEDAK